MFVVFVRLNRNFKIFNFVNLLGVLLYIFKIFMDLLSYMYFCICIRCFSVFEFYVI